MSDVSRLSVPMRAHRSGEREVEQIAFFRLLTATNATRWAATSELEFPQPYTILALEAHYMDLLDSLRLEHPQILTKDDEEKSPALFMAIVQRLDGSWSIISRQCSLREKLGRTLTAYELVKGYKRMPEDRTEEDRIPLLDLLEHDLRDLIHADERVEFAYILSVFEDSDGYPTGWAHRATSMPNRFELLGVLAIEIDELKDAIRNGDDSAD